MATHGAIPRYQPHMMYRPWQLSGSQIAVAAGSGDIIAQALTNQDTRDFSQLGTLLGNVDAPMTAS